MSPFSFSFLSSPIWWSSSESVKDLCLCFLILFYILKKITPINVKTQNSFQNLIILIYDNICALPPPLLAGNLHCRQRFNNQYVGHLTYHSKQRSTYKDVFAQPPSNISTLKLQLLLSQSILSQRETSCLMGNS